MRLQKIKGATWTKSGVLHGGTGVEQQFDPNHLSMHADQPAEVQPVE